MSRIRLSLGLLSLACLALALLAPEARAESWCAYPLWVHEWGVQSFAGDGRRAVIPMPGFFHRTGPTTARAEPPVRSLPPDTGERALPILQFYSGGSLSEPIPVAIEVGFTHGDASAWYPQVSRRTPAATANGPEARAARASLLQARAAQSVHGPRRELAADPTRQLEWSYLRLSRAAAGRVASSSVPWVDRLRAIDRALWVRAAGESERFVFYEANTSETVALAIERGPQHAPGRRHFVLRNRGTHAVHDVFVVHREASMLYVFTAPSIPAGATAGFVLEEHRVASGGERAATRDRLRTLLVDAAQPAPPARYRWDLDHCVMMRDPSIPLERAEGHRLYAAEADVLLDVWSARFFDQQGTTIVYREDVAYLDAEMPLSIYTDMYNYPVLRRLGLALWSGVSLP